ncbi:MAG: ribonuclease H-like domain-containing protein [Planctomycetota bacterium]|nr:ribonuclease H-like domain-containing protein [Planctomycetota bacterium]
MSESFGERLRRLRKETAPAQELHVEPEIADEIALPRPGLPAWFLGREPRAATELPRHDPRATVGDPTGLEDHTTALGPVCARTTRFAVAHEHGRIALARATGTLGDVFTVLTGDERLASLELARVVFLDIETTGLSGGAGTKAFLVGLGSFVDGQFELWQGFLRGPEDERALLAECADRIAAGSGLVSFFGKSFDRHRLEDKMRLHGVRPPFEDLPHLDLYHPCRRLYGGRFVDTRLATMERELCGVERDRDLPGAFAPAAWYDFLARRPHLLEEVFRHNRDDVLSLVTLGVELGESLVPPRLARGGLDTGLVAREAGRAAALARSFEKLRRWSECASWSVHAERLCDSASGAREFLLLRAKALERAEASAEERLACLRRVAGEADDLDAAKAALELALALESERAVWIARAVDLCRRLGDGPGARTVASRVGRLAAGVLRPRTRVRRRAP